jgi:hypothetical protein
MHMAAFLLASVLFLFAGSSEYPQEPVAVHAADKPNDHALIDRVVENQKKSDAAMDVYERLERVESHKVSGENQSTEVKVSRVVPAGTGAAHLPVGPDGKISDQNAYRAELEKLEKSLIWAAESGRTQREAYEKIAKKRREREELIGAARVAFLFTLIGTEQRDTHVLLKYRMDPNPAFRPTSRATSIYTRVRGTVWIDEATGEMARIEGEVTDDISLGLFLARVYRGSRFMQERYEMVPGLWLPSYSNYRRVGAPKEALELVRAELKEMRAGGVASR